MEAPPVRGHLPRTFDPLHVRATAAIAARKLGVPEDAIHEIVNNPAYNVREVRRHNMKHWMAVFEREAIELREFSLRAACGAPARGTNFGKLPTRQPTAWKDHAEPRALVKWLPNPTRTVVLEGELLDPETASSAPARPPLRRIRIQAKVVGIEAPAAARPIRQ